MREEKIIIGKDTEHPLNGLLTLPEEENPNIPGLVLVHGSGASDMDETLYENTPFKDIAETLAEHGVATLRYDKRTYVYGKKIMKNMKDAIPSTVYEEVIEDVILAANLLREDSRIGKVFMLGHSLGGVLAPRIEAMGGDFDGLIIAAGTPRTMREVIFMQLDDAIGNYKGLSGIIVKSIIKRNRKKLQEMDTWTEEELKTKNFPLGRGMAWYIKEMEEHPPELYTKNMSKPLFVFQGDKDFQVKVDPDFIGYQTLLADYPDVTFKIYEGLNHLFTTSHGTNSLKDYKTPEKVSSQVTDDIAAWIHGIE
jgi:dipeptidyl aminopeptidase/acylaminoacyl peptidase